MIKTYLVIALNYIGKIKNDVLLDILGMRNPLVLVISFTPRPSCRLNIAWIGLKLGLFYMVVFDCGVKIT